MKAVGEVWVGAPCPRFFVGVCVAAAPPVMCEARARRRRIAAATLQRGCCKRAVYAAARGARCRKVGSAAAAVICDHRCEFACLRDAARCGNQLFLASLGLGSLDLKHPRFFVQRPRTRQGSFFTGSWSPRLAVIVRSLAAPVAVPSASVGGVLRSSVVVVGGLYGLGSRAFRTFLGRAPKSLSSWACS